MMIKHSESNDVLKWTCEVLLIFFFIFLTKTKLKWAASVKHTPLSLTYAEWLIEERERPRQRHYHQQKILFRGWEVDLKNYMDMQLWPGGYKTILKMENKVGGYWISLLDLPARYHSWVAWKQ